MIDDNRTRQVSASYRNQALQYSQSITVEITILMYDTQTVFAIFPASLPLLWSSILQQVFLKELCNSKVWY